MQMAEGALGDCQTVMTNLKSTRDCDRDQQRSSARSGFIWVVGPTVRPPRSIDRDHSACTAAVFIDHRQRPETRRAHACSRNRKRIRLAQNTPTDRFERAKSNLNVLQDTFCTVGMVTKPLEWREDVIG